MSLPAAAETPVSPSSPTPATAAPARVRVPLRLKWTAALVATAAVPLLVYAVMALGIERRGLATTEKERAAAVLESGVMALDRMLDDSAEATHRVGRLLTEARINPEDARIELAREAMARAEVLAAVTIYGADGKLIDTIARKDGALDPPPPDTIDPATLKPDGAWGKPTVTPRGTTLAFVEPVIRDGEPRAIVRGALVPGAFDALLEKISIERYEVKDAVLLADGAGNILAGRGTGALAPGRSLAGKDLFGTAAAAALAQGILTVADYDGVDGEKTMGIARPMPAKHWVLVVRRPHRVAYEGLSATRNRLLGVGAGIVVAVLLLGMVLGASQTRPIGKLVALAHAYGQRQFSTRSDVKTGDELEQLGGAMTTMADDLAASEKEIARRAAVEKNLSRFLPGEVAQAIADGKRSLALGGERRRVTVLFADVCSFTSYSEGAAPETVVGFLNELFGVTTEVVFRNGGTVDKFIGDCVMAVFGAPSDQPDQCERAVACAEDMIRFVEGSAPAWKARYGVDARLAIGVATGEALVGNLGTEERMEYTAIGDVVNTAARLESLAKPNQVLVTGDVQASAGEGFHFASLGEHPIRGKKQAVTVYELA